MELRISRNGRCSCGSGRKYKQCCLRARSSAPESRFQSPFRLDGGNAISLAPPQVSPRPTISVPLGQRDWQEVHVTFDEPAGKQVVVVVLYSREWLRSRNVAVGGPLPLNIPQYGVRGEGRVKSIQPSSTVPKGEGLVVTCIRLKREDEGPSLPPVEKRAWQQVHVRLDEPGGTQIYVVLLHSKEWLQHHGVFDNERFSLNLPQQGVRGEGRVVLIEPSPIISDGEGLVMTFVRGSRHTTREKESASNGGPPAISPDIRTHFGESRPPVDHEWVQIALGCAGGFTSDLRLTRSRAWMRSNWSVVEHLRTDAAVPSEVDAWRLVHAVVSVQEGKKVHVAFFWQRRWVEAHGLTVGESVLLRLPKDHLCGEGSLTAIEPAPFVPGRGEPQGMLIVAGKQGGEGRGTVDTMDVGDYVTTYTHEERGDRSAIDDTQGEWVARQRVRLHLDKEDGGHSSLVLLREAEWVAAEKVVPGGTVFLNMPEMGTVGHATVEGVEPCLVFRRRGNSSIRMVTGTFRHSESRIGDLKLRGEVEPLGVTPKHPIWSVDRRDWVPAGELVPGETVQTLKGTTTVESYVLCAKCEPVFNLEVDGDHCYRVGEQGILVHNSSEPSAELTKQVTPVIEKMRGDKKCSICSSLHVVVADVPWSSEKNAFPADMRMVYLLRDYIIGKIMKVGSTGSKYETWKGRWDDYRYAEELCGLPARSLVIDAWAYPWVKGADACVPTREAVENELRAFFCKTKATDCLWDNTFLGVVGPGVPGEADPGGEWVGCKWVPGPKSSTTPYKKLFTCAEVLDALVKSNWNNVETAKLLGVTEAAVRYNRVKFKLKSSPGSCDDY